MDTKIQFAFDREDNIMGKGENGAGSWHCPKSVTCQIKHEYFGYPHAVYLKQTKTL